MKSHLRYLSMLIFCSGGLLFTSACGSIDSASAAPAAPAAPVDTGKNIMNAVWMTPPALDETLLSSRTMIWNFGFRPYSKDSAASLWTDPSVQRDAASGKATAGARPTALSMVCDEYGFAMYVFSGEPELAESQTKGKDAPSSMLECYISPRDADNEKIEHYYQFMIDQKTNTIRDFPWLQGDRNFAPMNGQFRPETRVLSHGYLTKLYFPWSFFWNRLPFLTQDNNVWRLCVMRWCPGSQTWGGIVHELSRMGYVIWPDFTPERRAAIMKNILQYAWTRYIGFKKIYSPASFPENTAPYVKEIPQDIRSYVYIPEYRDFDRDVLNAMIAERDALGAKIAAFDSMTFAEQEAFYRENAGRLISFQYDVQEAFRTWLEGKLMEGETAK